MPNNSPKSANRSASAGRAASVRSKLAASPGKSSRSTGGPSASGPPVPVVQALTLIILVGYLALFFRQPSVAGLVDQNGEVVDRMVDLLVLPSVAASTVSQFSLGVLWDRASVWLVAAVWLGAAAAIGWPLLLPLRTKLGRLERGSLACLTGLGLMSTAVLLVGLSGGIHSRWPLVLVIAMLVAASSLATLKLRNAMALHEPGDAPERKPRYDSVAPDNWTTRWMQRLIPVGVVLLSGLYLLGSVLPAWEFDVIEYHLQAPKEFTELGRIEFLPHNIYANMPLGTEMHSLATMLIFGGDAGWWWGGLSGKVVTGCITVCAALLLGGFTARQLGSFYGWLAGGLLLSMPGMLHVSWSGLVDGALAAYVLATLIVSHSILSKTDSATGQSPWLLLGLVSGGALSVKYTGLVFAILPCAIVFLFSCWGSRQLQWRGGLLFFAGLAMTGLPWLAKNAVLAGNPVYPLAYEIFGGRSFEPEQAARWQAAHRPGGNAVAAQAFSAGAAMRAVEAPLWASPFVNPGLVFLAGCGSLIATRRAIKKAARRSPESSRRNADLQSQQSQAQPSGSDDDLAPILALGIGLWIFAVWWFATHRIDRFWLPAIPLLCYLAAFGSEALVRQRMGWLATAIVLAAIAYGTVNGLSGASPVDSRVFEPLAALRAEAAEPERASAISPTLAWLNLRFADSDDRLLLIGEARVYPLLMPVAYATCFDAPAGISMLNDRPVSQQRRELRSSGINYIVVNWTEIARYRSPGNYGFHEWPTRETTQQWIASGLVEPVTTPFPPSALEVFRVRATAQD